MVFGSPKGRHTEGCVLQNIFFTQLTHCGLVNHALLPFFWFIDCVIKCVKSTRVLKGKFASSVFQSCKEKTPKTRKLVSGPHCVKRIITYSKFEWPRILETFYWLDHYISYQIV
jgi:hypothetical protein